MRLRHNGFPTALLAATLPLITFVVYAAGSGFAPRAARGLPRLPPDGAIAAQGVDRFDLDLDHDEIRSAHLALLNSRLDDWERRAAGGDGAVRLTAREVRYLRRVSAEIAKPP